MLWEKKEIQFEHIWFQHAINPLENKARKDLKTLCEHINYLGTKWNDNGGSSFSWSNFINCETTKKGKSV
jgi:hypothetical protein